MKMNKKELTESLAEKGYTKKDAHRILNDFFDVVGDALMDGHEVRLSGIGVLTPSVSEERTFWSGLLKESVTVPRRIHLKFRPSKGFQRDMTHASPLM